MPSPTSSTMRSSTAAPEGMSWGGTKPSMARRWSRSPMTGREFHSISMSMFSSASTGSSRAATYRETGSGSAWSRPSPAFTADESKCAIIRRVSSSCCGFRRPPVSSEFGDRLQRFAFAERAQRRGVAIDSLLDDLAVFDAELVDAAPVEPATLDVARGLPLDDHDIAARGPVQQLPDKIRCCGFLHLHQAIEFASRDRSVHQRRVQQTFWMPEIEKGLAVSRRPGGSKSRYKILNVSVVH